jgi:hypothetical protein
MAEQYEPAVQRTPREIWWKILEEFIYGEGRFILSTTFQGGRWSDYSDWNMFWTYRQELERFEQRRKTISLVCRSWHKFAHSQRHLEVNLKQSHGVETLEEIGRTLQARSVTLDMPWNVINVPAPLQGFDWEIAEISDREALLFSSLPLPRLRRLRVMCYRSLGPLNLNPLLDILSKFPSITWLDYETSDVKRGEPVPIKDRSPIVMPNLQVLWYKNRKTFKFPFSHLILPSLQYLAIQIYECPTLVPLLDLLSCYRKTLRSFVAARFKHAGDRSFIDFPLWEDFHWLEELVLDEQWVVHFQSLPPNHPLQMLNAHFGSFDVITSLLEGTNMQQIILRGTYWTIEGGMVETSGVSMEKVDVNRLLERAADHGTEFWVTLDGFDFPNRDEVITGAREATPEY